MKKHIFSRLGKKLQFNEEQQKIKVPCKTFEIVGLSCAIQQPVTFTSLFPIQEPTAEHFVESDCCTGLGPIFGDSVSTSWSYREHVPGGYLCTEAS